MKASIELSGEDYRLKASAFEQGVLIALRFWNARQGLLQKYSPEALPHDYVNDIILTYIDLGMQAILSYPPHLRAVVVREFLAGLFDVLLTDPDVLG